ncbi:MAG TPA: hypothetical protein VGC22_09235 [Chitinophaga sp.]
MSFKFGLFKGLSLVNLVISGFLGMCLVLVVVFTLQMGALIILFLVGAATIHSWLSLSLYRSLANPQWPLKENTPDGLRIIGAIAALYAFIMLSGSLSLLSNPDVYLQEMQKMNPDLKKEVPVLKQVLGGIGVFMLLYGASLMVNYLLSLSFLQTWKYRRRQDDEQVF